MTDTDQRFIALLEESAKREQELKHKLLEARWSQESTAAKAANLEVKLKESQRDNQVLREEVKQQAICNGAGGSRELALRTTIADLQRENAALMHIAAAAKALVDYDIDGEALNWPESNQKFENLKAAIEARKEKL